jgi:hypothetical protein
VMDAYENSAKRLMDASVEDRAWVLAQLSPEERIRIVAVLRDLVEAPDEAHPEAESIEPENGLRRVSPEHEKLPALAGADSVAIEKLLGTEPDWIVAMLVRDARWPWVEGFLAGLDPARLNRIECWVRIGHETIRPAVMERLLKLTNQKLVRPEGASSAPTAFDDILARLRTKPVDNLHNKAQAPE